MGRWLNRDPIEEEGGLNLHVFLVNDGINKIDYLGNYSWTKATAIEKLQNTEASWRSQNLSFAADMLSYFIKDTTVNYNAYNNHTYVKDYSKWRGKLLDHLYQSAKDTIGGAGEIGDSRLKGVSPGATLSNPMSYKKEFEYRFYPNENWHLFLALFGSRYSYHGKICLSQSNTTMQIDLTVLLVDQINFVKEGLFRTAFPSYSAANYLATVENYKSPYLYAVWHEKGEYKRVGGQWYAQGN